MGMAPVAHVLFTRYDYFLQFYRHFEQINVDS